MSYDLTIALSFQKKTGWQKHIDYHSKCVCLKKRDRSNIDISQMKQNNMYKQSSSKSSYYSLGIVLFFFLLIALVRTHFFTVCARKVQHIQKD